jgi:hypothetical protein
MAVTKKQAKEYFEIMVENQSETVVEILMQLLTREVKVDDWIKDTIYDISDSLD